MSAIKYNSYIATQLFSRLAKVTVRVFGRCDLHNSIGCDLSTREVGQIPYSPYHQKAGTMAGVLSCTCTLGNLTTRLNVHSVFVFMVSTHTSHNFSLYVSHQPSSLLE